MKKKIIVMIIFIITLMNTTVNYCHSGRTDGNGGHKDNKNVSGLGNYHYHHGEGPHLHSGGVCPYETPVKVDVPEVKVNNNTNTIKIPIQPKNIITSESKISLNIEETKNITATIEPFDSENKNLTWKSSNEKIIKIESGKITAVGVGVAIITISTSNNISKEIEVIVKEIEPLELKVEYDKISIKIQEKKQVATSLSPNNVTNKTLIWNSSDNNIVKVDNGILEGINEGNAIIKVTTSNNITKEIAVKVEEIESIKKNESIKSLISKNLIKVMLYSIYKNNMEEV